MAEWRYDNVFKSNLFQAKVRCLQLNCDVFLLPFYDKLKNLTGSQLIECDTIDAMRDIVTRLNALEMVNYAEPVYKVFASTTK